MRLGLSNLKRQLPLVLLTFLVMTFFLAHTARYFSWRFLTRLENFAHDTRIVLSKADTVDPRIVIVDIDEKSLAEEGHWLWGRRGMACSLTPTNTGRTELIRDSAREFNSGTQAAWIGHQPALRRVGRTTQFSVLHQPIRRSAKTPS